MSHGVARGVFIAFVVCVVLLVVAGARAVAAGRPRGPAGPALFVENRGQFDARARFQLSDPAGTWWLSADALRLVTAGDPAAVLRLSFDGADPAARLVALDAQPARVNYFIGRDPTRWRTDVPTFAAVRWDGAAGAAPVVLCAAPEGLRMRLDGAPPANLRLRVTGAAALSVDAAGRLVAATGAGPAVLPDVYAGERRLAPRVDGSAVTFAEAPPVDLRAGLAPAALRFSTYLGGTASDVAAGIAVDAAGNAYVTGSTQSTDFPVDGTLFGTYHGDTDAFVTKFVPSGGVMYSTYLGGTGTENGAGSYHAGIAVDGAGNVYVTGATTSADFPVANAIQPVHGPTTNPDAFVTKINTWGNQLVYSTFLGASGSDAGRAIAVDSAGSAYVVGEAAGGFPVVNPIQTFQFGTHVFISKINPAGSALAYSTYLGGYNTAGDYGFGVAVDTAGSAYVTGRTTATDFPVVGGVQGTGGGSYADGFITKVNPAGSAWVYSTYLGGSRTDAGYAVAVDPAHNAYVTGETESYTDFPVANALRSYGGGRSDSFVTKLNAAGNALVYSTYLGGNDDENYSTNDVGGIQAGANGDAYVTGYTCSPDFPLVHSLQPFIPTRCFGFVSRFASGGQALLYSTLLGTTAGNGDSSANAVALGGDGSVYTAGGTYANDFLTFNAWQPVYRGLGDAFVTRLTTELYFYDLPTMLWGP